MRYLNLLIAVLMLSACASARADLAEDIVSIPTNASAPAAASADAPAPAPKELSLLDKVAKFEKGKTTYSDVVRELGQPVTLVGNDNDTKTATYSNITGGLNAAAYIPIVGLFAGKVTVKGSGATLIFDKKDVLISKTTTQM